MSERARGQWVLGLAAVLALVAGLAALSQADTAWPDHAASVPQVANGAWYCPHGGGEGWSGRLLLANPGSGQVTARVTSYGPEDPTDPETVELDPGTTVSVPVRADSRGASSMVEYFGGWLAAGWVTQAGGDETGAAAEPCAPEAGERFLMPDGTTDRGHTAYVVVMNPFSADAVFTVTVSTQKGRPIVLGEWRDFVLRPGHSVALELNRAVAGEPAVGASVDVSQGRVAAASLGTLASGGIRSVIGVPAPSDRSLMPGGLDTNSAMVDVMNPTGGEASLQASVLTDDSEQTGAGIQGQTVPPDSAKAFSVITSSPSSIDLRATFQSPAAGIVATRRTFGISGDFGATAGVAAPGPDWVILPAVTETPPFDPRLLLTNPGESQVRVELRLLGDAIKPIQVNVPARRTVLVPTDFTSLAPQDAVTVHALSGGEVAPVFVAYSDDGADYAVSVGLPVPGGLTVPGG